MQLKESQAFVRTLQFIRDVIVNELIIDKNPAKEMVSYLDLLDELENAAKQQGFELTSLQSNSESVLIDAVHNAFFAGADYFIINPAAYTHTSIGLRDALLAVNIPFIEVHISNIHARESFRHKSFFSDLALGVISGLGTYGYLLALNAIVEKERAMIHGHS